MLRLSERSLAHVLLFAFALCVLNVFPAASPAVGFSDQKRAGTTTTPAAQNDDAPPYHEYKGVRIGMTADDARRKLGDPTDKGDKQDFYSFSDGNEMAQVFYDPEKKVFAVSVIYVGGGDKAPSCKSVLGLDAETKPDGSVHRKIDYPKAGFWVAYSRTPGDSPMITVTMQKKP